MENAFPLNESRKQNSIQIHMFPLNVILFLTVPSENKTNQKEFRPESLVTAKRLRTKHFSKKKKYSFGQDNHFCKSQ